jgi:DNA-binding GntR family transcriptional regulator
MNAQVTLNRASLRDQLRDALEESIAGGAFGPGAHLNLASLAREFDASVTPVREALHQLERDGLVRLQPHRGFVVPELSRREVEDAYPVLAALEALAVRGLDGLDPARLDHLRQINSRLGHAGASPVRALRLDREWHHTLIAASGNGVLLDHAASLRRRLGLYELMYMRDSRRAPFSVSDHDEILSFICDGRMAQAAERLESHWCESVAFLSEWLDTGSSGSGPIRQRTWRQR